MKKININIDWSVVFWLGLITTFLWLLAKAVGLIHTLWYVEAIPYVGGMITIFAIVKELGKYVQKIDGVFLDIKAMKVELKGLRQDVSNLDKRVAVLETRI